jgi:hypothetical protein
MSNPTDPPDSKVQRVLISGREALTPEGLAAFYAALQGRPVTPGNVAEFRELAAKSAAARRSDGDPA